MHAAHKVQVLEAETPQPRGCYQYTNYLFAYLCWHNTISVIYTESGKVIVLAACLCIYQMFIVPCLTQQLHWTFASFFFLSTTQKPNEISFPFVTKVNKRWVSVGYFELYRKNYIFVQLLVFYTKMIRSVCSGLQMSAKLIWNSSHSSCVLLKSRWGF